MQSNYCEIKTQLQRCYKDVTNFKAGFLNMFLNNVKLKKAGKKLFFASACFL